MIPVAQNKWEWLKWCCLCWWWFQWTRRAWWWQGTSWQWGLWKEWIWQYGRCFTQWFLWLLCSCILSLSMLYSRYRTSLTLTFVNCYLWYTHRFCLMSHPMDCLCQTIMISNYVTFNDRNVWLPPVVYTFEYTMEYWSKPEL